MDVKTSCCNEYHNKIVWLKMLEIWSWSTRTFAHLSNILAENILVPVLVSNFERCPSLSHLKPVNHFEETEVWICILHHSSTSKWHTRLKYCIIEDKRTVFLTANTMGVDYLAMLLNIILLITCIFQSNWWNFVRYWCNLNAYFTSLK